MSTAALFLLAVSAHAGGPPTLPNPILFVTQFPIAEDFATIGSTFANHSGRIDRVGRGGDLYIRYPDGSLRNLTREAGFGTAEVHQGDTSIAVRDPSVRWSGDRALFSMVIGAPEQFQQTDEKWQIYEVTGFEQGGTVAINLVPNQPSGYNNITPIYGSDDRIIFTSDRPRGGEPHLYPQHDEYESTDTNTGLWSLDPVTGALDLLQHSPSGSFTPILDSFGRILFTRWDHLQRDQQADADELSIIGGGGSIFGTFDYEDESASAALLDQRNEVFPEPRTERTDLLAAMQIQGHPVNGLRFNHFSPWQIFQDGSGEETLNHIGRHELHDYFDRSLTGDPDIVEFIDELSGRVNANDIENFFQIEEDPTRAGRYFGVEAPEFDTHASGQVIRVDGEPGLPPDQMVITYVTHPDTATVVEGTAPPTHTGHYRDPLPLADGSLVATHTFETGGAANPYEFRLRQLIPGSGEHLVPGGELTPGLSRRVTFFDPDVLVDYEGPFWELSAVEVRSRPQPVLTGEPPLEPPEAQIFSEEGIDPEVFRNDLRQRGLALAVSRNVTSRDALDRQQPFNLHIPDGVSSSGTGGESYEIAYLQLFQADQVRGIGGLASPSPGRRPLARPLHDLPLENPPSTGPVASVRLGLDGSFAALVPAHRAVTWQLTADDGNPVLRERYWITFQPGEIRVCASCHGLSSVDQTGGGVPTNPPEALRSLLHHWLDRTSLIFEDGFESGSTTQWSSSSP